MHLTAIGFDRDYRLIGIVPCPDMAWVWKAQTAKLLQKIMNAPK